MKKKNRKKHILIRGILLFGIPTAILTCLFQELIQNGTILLDKSFIIRLIFYIIVIGLGAGISFGYISLRQINRKQK